MSWGPESFAILDEKRKNDKTRYFKSCNIPEKPIVCAQGCFKGFQISPFPLSFWVKMGHTTSKCTMNYVRIEKEGVSCFVMNSFYQW